MSSQKIISIGGGRAVQPGSSQAREVYHLALRLVEAGYQLHVGCAVGVDAVAIQAASAVNPSLLSVFAQFASNGAGAWQSSAVSIVNQAGRAGAKVHYLAGGNLSLPLRARLIKRSRAALAGVAAFIAFYPGNGTLAVCRDAIAAGIPVFCFSGSNPPACPSSCAGSWQPAQFLGYPCFQWQSVANQPALF